MKRGIWYPGLAAIVALSIAGLVVLGLAVYYLRKAMGINGQRRVIQNGWKRVFLRWLENGRKISVF